MEFLQYGAFVPEGELYARIMKSFDRMESSMYAVPDVFHVKAGQQSFDWPGDWEGRTLLAIIMLAKASGRTPKTLDAILQQLPDYLNKNGHMGSVIEDGLINEQLLAGNSWLMRALCELYEWKKEDTILQMIQAMIDGLILKTQGTYEVYPITKNSRQTGGGEEAGFLTGEVNNGWLSSTDIGCAFIMLDGASHAYHITKNPELYTVINDMIHRFAQADLMDATFQTHATLSATRGILRFYGDTKEPWLLELCEKLFDYYVKNGMTENYANYNWFGRPEWTEPCAIIDSYIAAMMLWQYTAKSDYLDYANNILYNGIYYAQRDNGGFGCDVCVGAGQPTVHPTGSESYEAWWCCTMRGGEGLAKAAEYMASFEDGTVYLPMYQCGTFTIGGITVKETTAYPYEGNVQIDVLGNKGDCSRIAFYLPKWVTDARITTGQASNQQDGFLIVSGEWKEGDKIKLEFTIPLYELPAISPSYAGWKTIRYGTLELTYCANDGLTEMPDIATLVPSKEEKGCFLSTEGKRFVALSTMTFKSKEEILNSRLQVLYKN